MDGEDLGVRLRLLRERAGLSQRRLALRTGVANATISQIESGSLNPTVGVLKKIVGGLSLSLAEFFSSDTDVEEGYFFRAQQLTELSEGGVSYLQVGGQMTGRAIQLLKERYRPGASTGRHALQHEGEECGIILSGQLTVSVEDQVSVLHAGDAYYFKSDLPHTFRNDGDEDCELISACTPPSF